MAKLLSTFNLLLFLYCGLDCLPDDVVVSVMHGNLKYGNIEKDLRFTL